MERVIHLRGATVTLHEDRMLVQNGIRKNKWAWIFAACSGILYALLLVWQYWETKKEYYLLLGASMGVLWVVNLRRWMRPHDKEEILLEEVQEINFHSSLLSGEWLDLKLENGRHQEIRNITPS